MAIRIVTGDCREVLPTLQAGSVQCCVTSPPYYGLRSYLPDGHPDKAKEIGLEPTHDDFIAAMVAVFREVRRVLREDGTLWLNIGDSYARERAKGGSGPGGKNREAYGEAYGEAGGAGVPSGVKAKDLLGIPWMLAFALRADGWYLRSDIIWAKPNPMPEPVKDRPTSAHEHVFLLSKRPSYFYDAEAIKEAESVPGWDDGTRTFGGINKHGANPENGHRLTGRVAGPRKRGVPPRHAQYESSDQSGLDDVGRGSGRNARNVWTITPKPYKESHFATMPPDLAERCILAGTSERGACPHCGGPWARVITKGEPDREHQRRSGGDADGEYHGASTKGHAAAGVQDASDVKRRILAGLGTKKTAGWAPTCKCPAHDPVPCVVLDPFGGAGTTGMVADRLRRDAVLIDLNGEYREMAAARLSADSPLFTTVT